MRGWCAIGSQRRQPDQVELNRILDLYGRKVAAGEWRDYAIDFLKDRAVFSVFRRASEVPLYRIEKNPKLARKQGARGFELRAAMSIHRAASGAKRRKQSVEALRRLYDTFTEGFSTGDLVEAKTLLESA